MIHETNSSSHPPRRSSKNKKGIKRPLNPTIELDSESETEHKSKSSSKKIHQIVVKHEGSGYSSSDLSFRPSITISDLDKEKSLINSEIETLKEIIALCEEDSDEEDFFF